MTELTAVAHAYARRTTPPSTHTPPPGPAHSAHRSRDHQPKPGTGTGEQQPHSQEPELWKPPLRSFWCTYSRAWIDVKHVYELNIAEAEKSALGEMRDTCPDS
ncbi:hypothetical protein AB0451_34895 [Streptomyces sp. NPDC052000]|uniref:hypothetical protein n=1 Tax=Streptomyces sp. NPDC052000 TaxID=3155676 RepID=UPI00344CD2D2